MTYHLVVEYSDTIAHTGERPRLRCTRSPGPSPSRGTDEMEEERWAVVGGVPGYEVSTEGRLRSLGRHDSLGRRIGPRILTNRRWAGRYLQTAFHAEGKRISRSIHLLVLTAFAGPRPAGFQACHNDGDRTNNRLSNLRWDTPSANQSDKVAHGTIVRGDRQHAARLSPATASWVKRLLLGGVSSDALSPVTRLSRRSLDAIRRGETWAWIQPAEIPDGVVTGLIVATRSRHRARQALALVRPGPRSRRAAIAAERAAIAETTYSQALALAVAWTEGAR